MAERRRSGPGVLTRSRGAEHRIAGAHLAARVMAVRLSEALAGLDRDRKRAEGLAEELAVERKRHATAKRELRVLLLRSSESLSQALTAHQTPALEARGRRPWWRMWRR